VGNILNRRIAGSLPKDWIAKIRKIFLNARCFLQMIEVGEVDEWMH